jgi:predicted dehydrogenase
MFAREDIDLVDLCVPNHLHRPVAEAAAQAGKHIVVPKPMTAYVGQDLDKSAAGTQVAEQSRETMLQVATAEAQAMVDAAREAGVKLMYGENWVYAPSVRRAAELMGESDGTIVEMRGGECHSGSHSPFSKQWQYAGGGALIRLGVHPIGAMIHLKAQEGLRRYGSPVYPVSVSAEVGDLTDVPGVRDADAPWVETGWQDVENWAGVLVTFSDASRGIANASDAVLGGMESRLEIFLSNGQFKCNMSPHDLLHAYSPHPSVLGDSYLMEKASTTAGWSTPLPNEDWTSGHIGMCQDFVRSVSEDAPPASGGDLGLAVTRTVYAAYLAAARGERVSIAEPAERADPHPGR